MVAGSTTARDPTGPRLAVRSWVGRLEPMGHTDGIESIGGDGGRRVLTSVTVTRPIAASRADVWAAISAPGNLECAHPYCVRNPVTAWPGPDARDEVHYLSGWVYERRFTDWLDGVGYDLWVGSRGQQPSRVAWRITDHGAQRADLTITLRPRPLDRIPRLAQRPVQLAYVRPLLRRYLDAVGRGFEWWITTGEPVSRNQFGRHPWFSEPR